MYDAYVGWITLPAEYGYCVRKQTKLINELNKINERKTRASVQCDMVLSNGKYITKKERNYFVQEHIEQGLASFFSLIQPIFQNFQNPCTIICNSMVHVSFPYNRENSWHFGGYSASY